MLLRSGGPPVLLCRPSAKNQIYFVGHEINESSNFTNRLAMNELLERKWRLVSESVGMCGGL